MEQLIGLASIAAIIIMIYAGMHVAVALGIASVVSIWLITGHLIVAVRLLGQGAIDALADYNLAVIPLFALMGIIVSVGGLGSDSFDVAEAGFRRLRGGLGMATVAANAMFAATTGLSVASAAVFTRIAVPEMIRHGYRPDFAVGVVAGSSVLGMLIPPSLLFILYAIIVEQSIGALFLAGIVPGLILAALYCGYIYIRATLFPASIAKKPLDQIQHKPMGLQLTLYKLFPTAVLILVVIGGIYGGVFTPTESGALGALAALLIVLSRRSISVKDFWRILIETGHITVTICILFVAATVYSRMLAFSGLPDVLAHWMVEQNFQFGMAMICYVAVVVLLGTILDAGSIMLIMVPVMLPIVLAFKANLIWFGVVTVISVEIGLLTPPFGVAVFVVKSALKDDVHLSLNDVFRAVVPFAVIMLMVVAMVVQWPALTLLFEK